MVKSDSQTREDAVLLRMLTSAPKPQAEMKLKGRASPKAPKVAE